MLAGSRQPPERDLFFAWTRLDDERLSIRAPHSLSSGAKASWANPVASLQGIVNPVVFDLLLIPSLTRIFHAPKRLTLQLPGVIFKTV